ncbi:MAG TPA: hypothetical protein VK507_08960 [Iamia sp.]|nr:hypothetical protein [Iamia sp.]
MTREHTLELVVDAEVPKVWRALHRPRPAGTELPWRFDYPGGSIEILLDGDEAGQGLVRACTFRVPRYLLSGGVARSFEAIVEARVNELSRYSAVGKPLWSKAEGWHRLEEVGEGRTRLTFWERYDALSPWGRLLERRVHDFISTHNEQAYTKAFERVGKVTRP